MWFAMIMNRTFKGRGLVRAAILIPWAIPTAVTAKLLVLHLRLRRHRQQPARRRRHQPAPLDRRRVARPVRGHHRRRVEDDAVHGAADPRRPADHPAPTSTRRPRSTVPASGRPFTAHHPAAGQGAAHGRGALPHPRRAAHLRPAGHPHRRRRRQRARDDDAVHPGHQPDPHGFNSASALSTIVFLIISFVAFLFVKFLGADVVQRPPEARSRRSAGKDDGDARRRLDVDGSVIGSVGTGR